MTFKEKENYLTCHNEHINMITTRRLKDPIGKWGLREDEKLFEPRICLFPEEGCGLPDTEFDPKMKGPQSFKQFWNWGSQNVYVTLSSDKNVWWTTDEQE